MFDMTELSRKHTSEHTQRLLRRRRMAELRLKGLGIGAIGVALLALVALSWSVFGKAAYALFEYYVVVETRLELAEDELARVRDPNPALIPDLTAQIRDGFRTLAPDAGRAERRELFGILSNNAGIELGRAVKADPALAGRTVPFRALMDDDAQLYLKGFYGALRPLPTSGILSPTGTEGAIELLSTANDFADELALVKDALVEEGRRLRRQAAQQDNAVQVHGETVAEAGDDAARAAAQALLDGALARRDALLAQAAALEARAAAAGGEEAITDQLPSLIVRVNGGWARATAVRSDRIAAEVITPLQSTADAAPGSWSVYVMDLPQAGRRVTDRQIVWIEQLREAGRVERVFNWRFFTAPDSRDAELAGLYGALIGTAWTMLVTFLLAFPIGVAASIYLEEFAPRNRITNFIEVNINNLAAVPSIVFGLLGLAVVLPLLNALVGVNLRSAPLVGGAVMALMSLPTIIIASRAAIKAVPPSIREAALGVGASKLQTSFHHVLPLAMPGILTGTIIALAQALGETAPLIMIGMVAFIVEVPTGVTSSATVLPVQVFRWADFPEKLFELKTALAIVTLLGFLVVMNGLAVVLRKRFERRW
jgi:phosphate transport system permease protein